MSWNFETDPEFQQKLDWMDQFVREEIEPIDLVFRGPADPFDPGRKGPAAAMAPLKKIVQQQGLWACHLGPELGGQGYGQLKLGLMNEILGRSRFAPTVFGCQAPDTGNAEILAHFGTAEQKRKYLEPLLEGEIASCYSMTEPQAGADPGEFTCEARLVGDEWVINGEKWFASHADFAKFLLVVVITDKSVPVHQGASILIVDRAAPGLEIIRNVAVGMRDEPGSGVHGYLRFTNCRVPAANILGRPGQGFEVAQSRLGGGRIHHAMRTVGVLKRALDMMCERALSRAHQGRAAVEQAADAGEDRRLLHPDQAVPAARALRGMADRQAQVIQPRSAQGDRGREGCNAWRAAGRGGSRAAPARFARHVERDAADGDVGYSARNGHRRRPDRGAQDRRGQGVAA